MEKAHSISQKEIFEYFKVDPKKGLSSSQVEESRKKYGLNKIPEKPPTPFWVLVLKQFDDILIKILLFSAGISFVFALLEKEKSFHDFVEPFVILSIIVVNSIIGVWQESGAESAINALKQYEVPEAVAIRNGEIQTVKSAELVPGDIILIAVGGKVPADARVLELNSTTLKTIQSALTGEPDSVMKDPSPVSDEKNVAVLQDKTNIVFNGTLISHGKAKCIVTQIGAKTEIGKISNKLNEQEETKTPLQNKLDEFGKSLSVLILIICIIVWLVNIPHFNDEAFGGSWFRGSIYYFKIAISLAVAAIPEGLPAVVTTCLSIGTAKMAKRNAIVRSLPSVETLGCTTVICSDKTGTLTTNKMSVIRMYTVDEPNEESDDVKVVEYEVENTKYHPVGKINYVENGKLIDNPAEIKPLEMIATVSSTCNDSNLTVDNGEITNQGEPTELALRIVSEKIGIPKQSVDDKMNLEKRIMFVSNHYKKKYPKKYTLEFTRARKSMGVYCDDKKLFVKGAYEAVLYRCDKILYSNGKIGKLTKQMKDNIFEYIKKTGGKAALRCIGSAYKDVEDYDTFKKQLPSDILKFDQVENNMVFCGVCGMIDPARKEVKPAISECKTAGIRVIVITGDNKNTAAAICRNIGVFGENESIVGKAFTGAEFQQLSQENKEIACKNAKLFARVEPKHKIEIVTILQKQGEVCAMTGDGVNDAPALKKAEIGIAMGTGTSVAKDASKMILQDDSFASIVHAVEEGRSIYNNTKQFIRYLISSNIGEVVSILVTALIGLPESLAPIQLLFLNLVSDGLPATALGFNPKEPGLMKRFPRNPKEKIINKQSAIRYFVVGFYVGISTIIGFVWWFLFYSNGPQMSFSELTHWHSCVEGEHSYSCKIFKDPRPSTIAVTILVMVEMFNALNAVSEIQSIFTVSPFRNLYLMGAILSSIVIHLLTLYVPLFSSIFGCVPLNTTEWIVVLIISAPIVLIDELLKLFERMKIQNRGKKIKTE